MRDLRQFWSARRITDSKVTLARLGPLRLWLARAGKEWGFSFEHGEETDVLDIAQVPEDVVPDNLDWVKAAFTEAPPEFLLKPAVPDRPLVVKPSHPVLLPDKETAAFHILVPVSVKICVTNGRREVVLGTVPSRELSDTWFGIPTEGELCYALPRYAERELEATNPGPNHLVCLVEIHNRSGHDLQFEKLCFRPRHAGIYCGSRHLWSSRVLIQHEGTFKGTNIRYRGGPATDEEDLLELAAPHRREDYRLSRLTFTSSFGKDVIFGK